MNLHLIAPLIMLGPVALTAWALIWTVQRILRPVDQAAKGRNTPFRFSMGDFLCLFWMIQLPLAFVFQIDAEETEFYYWVLTIVVWMVAPLVWFTCASVLSKAGVGGGKHRVIFLAGVVPAVYYGLFLFIWLSWAGAIVALDDGPGYFFQHLSTTLLWFVLLAALVAAGLYSPWMIRQIELPDTSDA